jgi:predicted LPLAT superfamily acyltransferase
MLADRTLPGDAATPRPFLGASAAFPTGPARLAELLRVPVVLMVGLFLGGNRYEIRFERITPTAEGDTADAGRLVDRYVARLEYYCRLAPYNWFNFYDFWA